MDNTTSVHTIKVKLVDELKSAAQQLLTRCKGRSIFVFKGQLGAGKTTFIKAICSELGVADLTSSPTFALANQYTGNNNTNIFHLDLYRLNSLQEAADIGIDDYLYDTDYCFIEWPELIESILPADTVWVSITQHPDQSRSIHISLN